LASSSVEGIIAQRLVRVLCPECKVSYKPQRELVDKLSAHKDVDLDLELFRPVGCEKCRYTGFRGRTAVYEIVKVNEQFRRLIVERAPANVLRKEAIRMGMRPIRHDGWLKVKAGITTIDEVLRVTMEDEFAEHEDI
jgi:type II secretory ATPase GspE/PulE/Tfp pilus assembly ATPase PilB-like protein